MCPVAKRWVSAVFTAAEEQFLAGISRELDRFKAGSFVRSITKWLPIGPAARAPEIAFSFGYFDWIGRFLRNDWTFWHLVSPFADFPQSIA